MLKAKMKKFLALVLTGAMLCGTMQVSAAESNITVSAEETTEFTVSFENNYAEVGVPLTAAVTGAENASYQWYVGGRQVSENSENFYIPTENDLEKWIEVRVTDGSETMTAKMYCSKLPVVYINTENGQEITSKENYIDATIRIQGNKEYESTGIDQEAETEIRGRGNSTWGQPKKPYKLKLGSKTNVLGMGKNKHWVLLANYLDESLMRNTLSYNLSASMGMEAISTVWVDLVMNGKYVGNYQLCENVRIDGTRIDIFDWEGFSEDSADVIAEAEGFGKADKKALEKQMSEHMEWITSKTVTYNGVTYQIEDYADIKFPETKDGNYYNGGYLLELDAYWDEVSKFKTNSDQPIQFKSPEFVATNPEMMNYVQGYVQAFENAVKSSDYTADYNGKQTHYSDLFDFEELVDYWLVTEIFFNEEMNKKSTYMYKDLDGKMIMGPIWDMDWTSGAGGTSAWATNQWATNYFNQDAQASQWYKFLVKDPYFLVKLQERYWEIRNVQVQQMLDSIDESYELIKESGKADSAMWHNSGMFDSDFSGLKTWLNTHILWMDQQMDTEDSFTAAFLSKKGTLQLSVTDQEGNALNEDYAEYAPADAFTGKSEDLILHMDGNSSGTAEIYINSKCVEKLPISGQGAEYAISASELTEALETKNVIEVKVKNNIGNVIASDYITVRQSTCAHSFEKEWTQNDTQHWKTCANCELQLGLADHSFKWIIDREATKQNHGIRHEECTVCGYARKAEKYEYVEIPADPSDDSKDLPVSDMTAISGSEQSGNEDDHILDSQPSSIWHTQHGVVHPLEERWCGVTLKEAALVGGIRCLPRTDGGNGTVTEYSIQYRASEDGEWIEAATGTWDPSDLSWKAVTFAPVMAKQVRIVGVHTVYHGDTQDKHMSMSEFRLIGAEEVPEVSEKEEVIRLFGTDRYQTGIAVANELKTVLGVEKFETAIIATGTNFADALSGSYLAAVKHAPILLTNGKEENVAALHTYIKENVAADGTIYVLGGEKAVSKAAADIDGYQVERLSGADRYETNLAILAEAGIEGADLIVATGKDFADSLSASAAAKPILLVKKDAALSDAQKAVAASFQNIYIVGGAGAVAESAAEELEEFGTVIRISGASRYETSVAVAETFFENPEKVVLAYGKKFPDGLCGGALAAALNAPLILTKDGGEAAAAEYVSSNEIKSGYVLGGEGVLANETVGTIFPTAEF